MDMIWPIVLIIASYWLGACPFAYWVGRKLLHKDIRNYGDHNPGSANVFKAGSIGLGFLSVFLDIAKGSPFVFLSYYLFGFHEIIMYLIGLSAIVGHAFSPFLNFRGGKAYAVTLGVILTLPEKDVLFILIVLLVLGFLLFDGDGWRTTMAVAAVFIFTVISGKSVWEITFFGIVLALMAFKNSGELKSLPRRKKKLYIGFGQEKIPEHKGKA